MKDNKFFILGLSVKMIIDIMIVSFVVLLIPNEETNFFYFQMWFWPFGLAVLAGFYWYGSMSKNVSFWRNFFLLLITIYISGFLGKLLYIKPIVLGKNKEIIWIFLITAPFISFYFFEIIESIEDSFKKIKFISFVLLSQFSVFFSFLMNEMTIVIIGMIAILAIGGYDFILQCCGEKSIFAIKVTENENTKTIKKI
jgi:hypothetical protein